MPGQPSSLVLMQAMLLVAAAGCSGGPGAGDAATFDDCPQIGAFDFTMDWDPGPGSSSLITSSGRVLEVVEDPPGMLSISIELTSGEDEPGVYTYQVPLPPGAGIDLFVDDEVTVSTQDLWGCLGCWIYEITIEREDEVILHALDCWNELCEADTFEVGPLLFSTLSGRCEPFEDPSGLERPCYIKEHNGLEVTCPGGPDEQVHELFRGQEATLECGATYHVSTGNLMRILEGPPEGLICSDFTMYRRQILVIRDGDGLGSG